MLVISNRFTMFPILPIQAISAPPEVKSDKLFSLFKIIAIIEERLTIIPANNGARKTMFERMSDMTYASKSLRRSFIF